MNKIKYIWLAILIALLSSCGIAGSYYVLEDGGEQTSHTSLHNDDKVTVHLHHFNGYISTVRIYQHNKNNDVELRSANVRQSVSYDGKVIRSSSRDDTASILESNPESSVLAQITEIYELEEPVERVVEKIEIDIILNEYQIHISKEFSLKRVTYSNIEAIMAI